MPRWNSNSQRLDLEQRWSDFQSGGGGGTNKKGHFLGKKGTYKGKSQSENKQFLDIGIYP